MPHDGTSLFRSVQAAALGHRRVYRAASAHLASLCTQLPDVWWLDGDAASAHITDVSFDDSGELLASCSSDGRVVVHHLEQFASGARRAEAAAIAAAERSLDDDVAVDLAVAAAADAAAGKVRHASECEPLFCAATCLTARAARWSPVAPNELIAGFANSNELHVFDLGAADPKTPARLLRSSSTYPSSHGVHDIVLPQASTLVVGAGRDGLLRVWDLRAANTPVLSGPAVLPMKAGATAGWTMGTRTQNWRAGATNALVATPDGGRLYAATDEGNIIGWDVRNCASALHVVRVGRALSSGGGCEGLVALSHHPTLRHTMVAQLSSGCTVAVDVETAAVLAIGGCAEDSLREQWRQQQLQQRRLQQQAGEGESCGGGSSASRGAMSGTGGAASGELDGEIERSPVDWRVRCRRGAWLSSGGGTRDQPLWCCGRATRTPPVGLSHFALSTHCHKLRVVGHVPTSASVVAVDAHPRGHYLALGMRDNTVGLLAPALHRPTVNRQVDVWLTAQAVGAAERKRSGAAGAAGTGAGTAISTGVGAGAATGWGACATAEGVAACGRVSSAEGVAAAPDGVVAASAAGTSVKSGASQVNASPTATAAAGSAPAPATTTSEAAERAPPEMTPAPAAASRTTPVTAPAATPAATSAATPVATPVAAPAAAEATASVSVTATAGASATAPAGTSATAAALGGSDDEELEAQMFRRGFSTARPSNGRTVTHHKHKNARAAAKRAVKPAAPQATPAVHSALTDDRHASLPAHEPVGVPQQQRAAPAATSQVDDAPASQHNLPTGRRAPADWTRPSDGEPIKRQRQASLADFFGGRKVGERE